MERRRGSSERTQNIVAVCAGITVLLAAATPFAVTGHLEAQREERFREKLEGVLGRDIDSFQPLRDIDINGSEYAGLITYNDGEICTIGYDVTFEDGYVVNNFQDCIGG